MGVDLVTEEESATVEHAVPCKIWETTWGSANGVFMWTFNVLYSKPDQVNSTSTEHSP